MANRNWASAGKIYSMHVKPVLLDCNFIVDSQNGNGVRSLKGPCITSVTMNSNIAPAGSPNMGTARSYAVLGTSAVTNTGSSVLTGNLGISPGIAITGFPAGTFTGSLNSANASSASAKAFAQSTYTTLAANGGYSTISNTLDGQSLTAGYYTFSAGDVHLATSANGTLTLTGSPTDIFVFKTPSTLTTGAGGIPTITLAGGALASNVYWVVGSSATINSGSAGTFNGNLLAQTSITDTLGGTVNGSLIALNGAVTLSAAAIINAQPFAQPANSVPYGYIKVKFADNYNRYLGGFNVLAGPVSGTVLTSTTAGAAYTIVSLGTATAAQWAAKGFPAGFTPQVGSAFIASASGSVGGSAVVEQVMSSGSGIDHIELVGDPNTTLANSQQPTNGGGYILFACFANGVITSPADGTTVSMSFYFNDSSVMLAGE